MKRSPPQIVSPLLASILATAAFAVVHSALASIKAKELAAERFGVRERDGAYRVFYNTQAVLTFAALLVYLGRLPKHTIYEAKGPSRGLFRLGQLASLAFFSAALAELGVWRMSGFRNFTAWVKAKPIPVGPAAQGPELNPDGTLSDGSAYRLSRHPLNASMTALFWATPHLTTKRLGFNAVSTIYFVLGSFLEEHRLKAQYGETYERYRQSGVPFFVPKLTALSRRESAEVELPLGAALRAHQHGHEPVVPGAAIHG